MSLLLDYQYVLLDVWFLMLVARLINALEVLSAITLPLPWDRDRFVTEMAARSTRLAA